jgi:D-threo-aldose 1-dehydrogenase
MNNAETNINLAAVIFGTSGLGNLFVALKEDKKLNIVSECVRLPKGKVVFGSAGKYGAGLIGTEADWKNWKKEDFKPYMDVVVNAFGTTGLCLVLIGPYAW